jgi:hypothetical protein
MSKETRVDPYDRPTLRWRLVVHRLRPCAERAGGTHFLLSVHDELVLECLKEAAWGVAVWLKAKMGEAMQEILGREQRAWWTGVCRGRLWSELG